MKAFPTNIFVYKMWKYAENTAVFSNAYVAPRKTHVVGLQF